MPNALLTVDGISCRVCGGVRAKRGETDAMCASCEGRFQYFREGCDLPEDEAMNQWIARQLFLDVRRLKKTGMVGRCEAVSNFLYGSRGYQCVQRATHRRDGYPVCGAHFSGGVMGYLHEKASDPYKVMGKWMKEIAKKDARFAEMLRKAAN